MSQTFRFSPRPNRAAEIEWRPWGAEAFDEAREKDRPVLLNLTAVWCDFCHRMDETTYSDERVIEKINEGVVPIRVDADRYPHVEQRYIAGGWPTNAFLTPSGEVLWAGTYVPVREFLPVARGVLEAWQDPDRRGELEKEVSRRRKAMEAARSQKPAVGLVRREAADDVLTAIQDSFDPRNGGFEGEPKFPRPTAIEVLFTQGRALPNPEWTEMAAHTLDGMLAGELWDDVEGGFFRYAISADWTEPRYEKLIEVNAELLRVYALGARLTGRDDWRRTAERIVDWAERALARDDDLWNGSIDADPEYYSTDGEPTPADARAERGMPHVDPTIYTDRNAAWARGLADAGRWLERGEWIERAAGTVEALLDRMRTPDGLFHHHRPDGGAPEVGNLLTDAVEVAQACVSVARASGRDEFMERAREIADAMEASLWADQGAFRDYPAAGRDAPGALRYTDRPFELNAIAARVLTAVAVATGDRGYRALAERTLAVLSPLAGRYGVEGAAFALAVEEFFASQ